MWNDYYKKEVILNICSFFINKLFESLLVAFIPEYIVSTVLDEDWS